MALDPGYSGSKAVSPSRCRTPRVRLNSPDETEVAATQLGASAPVEDLGIVDLVAESAAAVGHGVSPTAQSTSALASPRRQTMWWWLPPTRSSYGPGRPAGSMRRTN